MAIIAENKGGTFEPMPSGNYVARCYSMIQIGTVEEEYEGQKKKTSKVRLSFEFPTELKVFKEELGEQPFALSKEYTLSMHEKASLRKDLENWRGQAFTEAEAKSFDVSNLIGKSCMINVIHKVDSQGTMRAKISSISTMPKGLQAPTQINPTQLLSYDNFDYKLFETLPEYLRKKIESTPEYLAMENKESVKQVIDSNDSLPF